MIVSILGEKVIFQMDRREKEFVVSRNKLLGELSTLYKEYNITFDLMINSLVGETWQNIIHFTIGGNAAQYGDRAPAVWYHHDSNQLYVVSAINGNKNMEKYVKMRLKLRSWMKFEISQSFDVEHGVWIL